MTSIISIKFLQILRSGFIAKPLHLTYLCVTEGIYCNRGHTIIPEKSINAEQFDCCIQMFAPDISLSPLTDCIHMDASVQPAEMTLSATINSETVYNVLNEVDNAWTVQTVDAFSLTLTIDSVSVPTITVFELQVSGVSSVAIQTGSTIPTPTVILHQNSTT